MCAASSLNTNSSNRSLYNIFKGGGGGLNQTVDSDDDGLSTFISIIPLLITDMIITLIVWCVGRQHTEKSGIS